MKSATLTSIAILLAALPLCGQIAPSRVSVGPDSPARLEVALAYSTVRSDTIPGGCDCFWMQGGKAEFRATFSTKIGLVGEIAGQHARNINSAHTDVSLVSYLMASTPSSRTSAIPPLCQMPSPWPPEAE